MLEIIIPEKKGLWNEKTQEFLDLPELNLKLEHSLISVKKWEAKWHKPFLTKEEKTKAEVLDYIRCMTIGPAPDIRVLAFMPIPIYNRIINYIQDSNTAAIFSENVLVGASTRVNEIITAETIYFWMITLNIPVEFEKWHLEALLALIKFVNIKSNPKKKLSKKDSMQFMAEMNAKRRAMYKTKG